VGGWHEIRRSDVVYAISEANKELIKRDESRQISVPKVNALISKLGDSPAPKGEDIRDAFQQIADLLDQLDAHQDLTDVSALADAFSRDLRAKGIDAAELKRGLTAIGGRLHADSESARVLASGHRPFPDTRQNHWAYEAITQMKADGILVGYPNGNFIGGRLSTRHEMAVPTILAYSKLNEILDELEAEIGDARRGLNLHHGSPPTDEAQLKKCEVEKSDLRRQLWELGKYREDVSKLKRLVCEFGPEIAALGTCLPEFKCGLDAAARRIDAIQADSDLTRLVR